MTQLLALCLLYVATVAAYGSARVRGGGARLAVLNAPSRVIFIRCFAVLAIIAAATLWHGIEPGPAATFVVIVTLTAAGTIVTVLGSILPRVVWASALLTLLLISALAFALGVQP